MIVFIKEFAKIFGDGQITYNNHSLSHLVDDVNNYGYLELISAFKFESSLVKLKKLVGRPHDPLWQIVNRPAEYNNLNLKNINENCTNCCKTEHILSPIPKGYLNAKQYKQYKSRFKSPLSTGDNCFKIDDDFGIIKYILELHNIVYFVVNILKKKSIFPLFSYWL